MGYSVINDPDDPPGVQVWPADDQLVPRGLRFGSAQSFTWMAPSTKKACCEYKAT